MIDKLTPEQGIVLSAFTGCLCCNFSDFHKAVEERIGRPVWTHEFGSQAMADTIKELWRDDFNALMPEGIRHPPAEAGQS